MTEFTRPPDRFELSHSDKHSALWIRLKAYLEDQNSKDRKKNDDMQLTDTETRNLRAMIAARKSLLNLDQ